MGETRIGVHRICLRLRKNIKSKKYSTILQPKRQGKSTMKIVSPFVGNGKTLFGETTKQTLHRKMHGITFVMFYCMRHSAHLDA